MAARSAKRPPEPSDLDNAMPPPVPNRQTLRARLQSVPLFMRLALLAVVPSFMATFIAMLVLGSYSKQQLTQ
ncbi:MAG: hypothetical protein RR726_25950, partial [Pseudomonas sp.]